MKPIESPPEYVEKHNPARNPLGYGVTRKRGQYQAQIGYKNRVVYLGTFPAPEQAAACAAGALALRSRL